jgi:hypothetical protein
MRLRKVGSVTSAAIVGSVTTYLLVGRKPCLTWGATDEDVRRVLPGDEFLSSPEVLSTRAITISAPPSAVWPWLMQMGSGKGGVYTYDWIENLFGLNMHSVDQILPEFQDRKVGDLEQLGKSGPRMRVDVLDAEKAMVLHSEDGNWVWAFVLVPLDPNVTRLLSRNRISTPGASLVRRAIQTLVMEPGSLIMERKMLLGIKQRAEALHRSGEEADANLDEEIVP